jgi:shikimate dehydrogenase
MVNSTASLYTLEMIGKIPDQPTPYAVLGLPVSHSLSPNFQNAAFEHLKIPAKYYAIEVTEEQLPAAVSALKEKKFGGWNCTLPLKVKMAELVDEISPAAQVLGAVNTVLNENGRLTGFNTDAEGWVKAVREDFQADVHDLRIMILGAGGTGRALAIQAALEKCERLVIVNRTLARAEELAGQLAPHFSPDRVLGPRDRLMALPWDENLIAQELNQIDLLVNATSVGLKPSDPPVIPLHILQPHLLVYDTIYSPARTRLLGGASQAGARTANGVTMLLQQGAAAFAIWTGQSAPVPQMRVALERALAK